MINNWAYFAPVYNGSKNPVVLSISLGLLIFFELGYWITISLLKFYKSLCWQKQHFTKYEQLLATENVATFEILFSLIHVWPILTTCAPPHPTLLIHRFGTVNSHSRGCVEYLSALHWVFYLTFILNNPRPPHLPPLGIWVDVLPETWYENR